ncbi:MAG: hypothetical protein ACD_2C00039G0001 [uncultured bacterium (gcode 4)]|uniref:Protease PrsW n=1 Tax=uncultured bacterium (gcode 4) TaxID=1234023 RepID=K2G712_9BACT|nr:MAG: hypothetical protein ACD_2C00039G0001 [uncultured bacterium (gcode 4)]
MSLIFSVIWILIFAFLPILWWAYLFSYLDDTPLHSKRFIAWVIAWWISVVPVLYLEEIMKMIWLENFNILTYISDNVFAPVWVSVSVLATVITVWIFMFIAWMLFFDLLLKVWKTYLKNVIILCFFTIFFIVIYFIVNKISFFDKSVGSEISIWKNVFNTIWLVTLYYIVVWLLEESSKHFSFLPSSLYFTDSIKKWVLLAAFIALWFWFVENILYMWSITKESSFGWEAISIWIFRWIFSLFVHIICSIIVAKWFVSWYLKSEYDKSRFMYAKAFLSAIFLSIMVHALYDISLTLWFTAIIFIYFIAWYLYVTKIFYKEA